MAAERVGTARGRRAWVVLAGVLAVGLYYASLAAIPLLEPDEGRYAEIPREMLASGDLITPRLNGVLYFEKPPLYYWLNAAAIRAFGLNELACRFWSATLGLATALLVFALARRQSGRAAGLRAAAILVSSPFFALLSHFNTIDMTLTFFLTAALVSFWLAHDAPRSSRSWYAWYGVFAAAALSVLSKGLIGVVIPGSVILLYLLLTGSWRLLLRVPWLTGTLLFLALAVPWHVAMAQRNPGFLYFYFVHEQVLRYATDVAARGQPPWFFAAVLVVGCLPWTGLATAVARAGRPRRWLALARERPEEVFLLCWFGVVLVFFSLSRSKLAPYVLPALPPAAALAGLHLQRIAEGRFSTTWLERLGVAASCGLAALTGVALLVAGSGKVGWIGEAPAFSPALFAAGLALVVLALACALRWLRAPATGGTGMLLAVAVCMSAGLWGALAIEGPSRSSKAAAEVLRGRLRPGDVVVCYGNYRQSLPVYLERTVAVVNYHQELTFGISHLSPEEVGRRFPALEGLRELWSSGPTVYVLAEKARFAELGAAGLGSITVLLEGKRTILATNRGGAGSS